MFFLPQAVQLLLSLSIYFVRADVLPVNHHLAVRREVSGWLGKPEEFATLNIHKTITERGDTEPTLRQWLIQEGYHFALAPILASTSLDMGMLSVLESEGLTGHLLESFSGTSNGGVVASLWGTRRSKFANEYVKLWGKPVGRLDCIGNCSAAEAFYSDLVSGPAQAETDAMTIFKEEWKSAAMETMLPLVKISHPTLKSTVEHRIFWIYWLQLMHVPPNFHDIKLPIGITGYDKAKSLGILMTEGDIQVAVVGAASPHSISRGIRVEKFLIGDGYPADNFGFKGYDALLSSRDATITKFATNSQLFPPARVFNIIQLDDKGEVDCAQVNWTSLSHYKDLRQGLTILIDLSGQTGVLMQARRLHRLGLPYYHEAKVLESAYTLIMQTLDEQIPLFQHVQADDFSYFCSAKSLELPSLGGLTLTDMTMLRKVMNFVRGHAYDLSVKDYEVVAPFKSSELHWPLNFAKCLFHRIQRSTRNAKQDENVYLHAPPCELENVAEDHLQT